MSDHTVTPTRQVSSDANDNPKEKQLHEVTSSLAQEIKIKQTTTAGLDNILLSEKNTTEETSQQKDSLPPAHIRLWTQVTALVGQWKATTQQIKIAVQEPQNK